MKLPSLTCCHQIEDIGKQCGLLHEGVRDVKAITASIVMALTGTACGGEGSQGRARGRGENST